MVSLSTRPSTARHGRPSAGTLTPHTRSRHSSRSAGVVWGCSFRRYAVGRIIVGPTGSCVAADHLAAPAGPARGCVRSASRGARCHRAPRPPVGPTPRALARAARGHTSRARSGAEYIVRRVRLARSRAPGDHSRAVARLAACIRSPAGGGSPPARSRGAGRGALLVCSVCVMCVVWWAVRAWSSASRVPI